MVQTSLSLLWTVVCRLWTFFSRLSTVDLSLIKKDSAEGVFLVKRGMGF